MVHDLIFHRDIHIHGQPFDKEEHDMLVAPDSDEDELADAFALAIPSGTQPESQNFEMVLPFKKQKPDPVRAHYFNQADGEVVKVNARPDCTVYVYKRLKALK